MEKCLIASEINQTNIIKYMPNENTLENLSGIFSAFSDITRLKILTALTMAELCVNDISVLLKINQTTLSHQLKYLRGLGLIKQRRDGKIMFYSVNKEAVNEIMLTGVDCISC